MQITMWLFLFSVADNLDLPFADTIFKEGPGGGVELVEKTVVSKAELLNTLRIARSVTELSRSQSVRGGLGFFEVGVVPLCLSRTYWVSVHFLVFIVCW